MFDISLKYAGYFSKKNCYMNLTAVTEAKALAYLHFYDSLTLEPVWKNYKIAKKYLLTNFYLRQILVQGRFPQYIIASFF